MFSLPNIQALSDAAAKNREHVRKSKTLTCECCNKDFPKAAPGRYVEEWFDPFDDKPKGMFVVCPDCAKANEEKTGNAEPFDHEGYFRCDSCGRVHTTNYSWERYDVSDPESGEVYCMGCAAKIEARNDNPRWMKSRADVERVTESLETLQAYKPRHLSHIGGSKSLKGGLVSFRETPEFEAAKLDWFNRMECGGFGGTGGLHEDVRACALEALKHYRKAMFIIGEAGQFQAYGDIVVAAGDTRKRKA